MPKLKFNYFDAFERIAECACREAELLIEILENYSPDQIIEWRDKMHAIENEADRENHQIYKHLADEFVPPIEREDIIMLAQQLDNIVDHIDDVAQNLYIFNIQSIPEPAKEMSKLIIKACTALHTAVQDFRNFKKSKTLDQMLISVSDYEEEADHVYSEAVRALFEKHPDEPVYIIAWYHLLVRLERCIDSTENAADTVSTIVMKNT